MSGSCIFFQCTTAHFDIIITNGTVYDGTGNAPVRTDIGISTGVEYVLVNGDIVIEKGEYNGKLSGEAIRLNSPRVDKTANQMSSIISHKYQK